MKRRAANGLVVPDDIFSVLSMPRLFAPSCSLVKDQKGDVWVGRCLVGFVLAAKCMKRSGTSPGSRIRRNRKRLHYVLSAASSSQGIHCEDKDDTLVLGLSLRCRKVFPSLVVTIFTVVVGTLVDFSRADVSSRSAHRASSTHMR